MKRAEGGSDQLDMEAPVDNTMDRTDAPITKPAASSVTRTCT